MPRLKEFRVAGIFYSGHYEYDQKYAYVTLDVAQEFLRKTGKISGLELRTRDPEVARDVAERIRAALGPDSGYQVRPWQEIHKAIFAALQLEKIIMFVVLVVIVIVAAFSIVANLIMVVTEKSGEIAVLRSMGAKPKNILFIFLFDGFYIGVLGMAAGISLGIIVSLLVRYFGVALDPEVYYIQAIPVAIDPLEVVIVAGAVIAISLLAALFPAVRAMSLRPVQGLRYK
jgi:lipoprotein-releasing system permease protein